MLHVGRLQICSTYVGAPEAFILIFILSCTHGYATDIKIEPSITNYPTTMQHSFEHFSEELALGFRKPSTKFCTVLR